MEVILFSAFYKNRTVLCVQIVVITVIIVIMSIIHYCERYNQNPPLSSKQATELKQDKN